MNVLAACAGDNDAADVAASKAEGRLRMDMPKPATIADGDKTDAVIAVRLTLAREALCSGQIDLASYLEPSSCINT